MNYLEYYTCVFMLSLTLFYIVFIGLYCVLNCINKDYYDRKIVEDKAKSKQGKK